MAIDRDANKTAGAGTPGRLGAVGTPARTISAGTSALTTPAATGDPLRANLALMAPGTALRDGLERILRGRTGALIVLGYDKQVESLCTGGFPLDVEFSSTRVRELCKMDGAVVLSSDGTRIVRAAVHLMPDPSIPTEESGTRHRTAERVARQTGYPVISVSQSMRIISLYVNGQRHVLDDSAAILSRANQALATLERYKLRLDEVSGTLSALEIEDLVTVRDAVAVVQRLEMVRRIADEIAGYVVELGTDGRLLALQLDELMAGVDADRTLVIRDYLPTGRKARTLDEALVELDLLTAIELIDLVAVAKAIGYAPSAEALDAAVSPRGFRLLAKVPRLPVSVVDRLVNHFGSLQRLLGATVEDLQAVDGVGDTRARSVREGLSRLAEASILERYV
ncbi:DNA integrity scanning diadenylate cyclase DisA [Micromonospora sp. NBC_01813]|uniref:DNA integrity scanning diadenylate cyclase DisA n=1 Tax=Micromonospora sp. NBC_01813 TaxID=2975988 RepID=UPI002DD9BBD2|nr:DNA integrity scanning diadenylate cyclase DisA [Micromonospora sp. NBC_01813]WSA06724.1 DNA integrity scanning diadenylate cyclase DisA [Micromonospora sp. NBC_01813]